MNSAVLVQGVRQTKVMLSKMHNDCKMIIIHLYCISCLFYFYLHNKTQNLSRTLSQVKLKISIINPTAKEPRILGLYPYMYGGFHDSLFLHFIIWTAEQEIKFSAHTFVFRKMHTKTADQDLSLWQTARVP